MEKATYRQLQNFFGEIDEEKEFDIVLSLMRPEDYGILKLYPDMPLSNCLDAEHHLAYRLMVENEEEISAENFATCLNILFSSYILFNYYTDDIEALQKSPIDYLSDNYSDLYDDEGFAVDENGERQKDGEKLEVDLSQCYVIDGWTYELR